LARPGGLGQGLVLVLRCQMAVPSATVDRVVLLGRLSIMSEESCGKNCASPVASAPSAPSSPRPGQLPMLLGRHSANVRDQVGSLSPPSSDADQSEDFALLAAQAACEAFRGKQRRRAGRQSAFEV